MRHVPLTAILFVGLIGSCSTPPTAPGAITAANIALLSVRQTIAAGFSRRVGFTADGRLLIAGIGDQHVELRRISDAALMQTLPGAPPWLNADVLFGPAIPRISSGGSLLISADWHGALELYRLSDGTRLSGFLVSDHAPPVAAFSPNEQLPALDSDEQLVCCSK